MNETRAVIIERDIPHPPEKLWRALTQPHLIAEWLMNNDFKLELGHHFHMRGEWGGELDCEVVAIEPDKMLSYRWDFPHPDPAFAVKTVVTFTLTPSSTGTLLRVEQAGFRTDQGRAFGGATQGWPQFLAKLELLLTDTD